MNSPASRDREELWTPFTPILDQLVDACPGSLGAAFVDSEGETVDYAGCLDPFGIKVAAAHLRILLHEASAAPAFQPVREMMVRSQKRTFLIRAMPEGYALVLLLPRRAFSVSRRALDIAARALALEAALPTTEMAEAPWHPIQVEPSPRDRRRPARVYVGTGWESLETVLGAVAGLPKRELGFRVRLRSGAELTIVREPNSRWYSDEVPAEAARSGPKRAVAIFGN